jgi:hypothetical protein
MGTGRSRRPSAVLVTVLLVALASGAAASLIIGSATAPSAPTPRASEIVVPESTFVYLLFAFLLITLGFAVYRRLTDPHGFPARIFITFLFAILVAVLFVVAVELLGGGTVSLLGAGPAGPGGNSTGSGQPPPNANTTNTTHSTSGFSSLLPGLPGWLTFAALAGVVLIVAAVALPAVRAYTADRRASGFVRARTESEAKEVRAVLEQAEKALAGETDPRRAIVRLYGELLARLGSMVGDVEPETPEEIRTLHLERLGIRPAASTELTRLFEEARYSSHPLGPDASERARTAVRQALDDLNRTPGAS